MQQVNVLPAIVAGVDWQWNSPSGHWSKVVAVNAQLASSATAGTRYPTLAFVDSDGNRMLHLPPFTGQGASSTEEWGWGEDLNAFSPPSVDNINGLPGIWLPPGGNLHVTTTGLDAADHWTGMVVTYRLADWELVEIPGS